MVKSTFGIKTDSSGREFVYQKEDEFDKKNHRDSSTPDDTVGEGRIYAMPAIRCVPCCHIKVTWKDSILSWTKYDRGHVTHTKKMNKCGIVDQLQEKTCWQE